MSVAADCKACERVAKAGPNDASLVWMNELWMLRHSAAPYPTLGWMTLHSRRHIPGVVGFTDAEAADFGRVLKHISQALIDATGAQRVYLGSLSEGTPHFHVHLVPRYAEGPSGWDAFGDLDRARKGLTTVDAGRVGEVISVVGERLTKELSASPQPA
jgi:diadenosine tetraphosphate (Ap4A) HIT family hydrolase